MNARLQALTTQLDASSFCINPDNRNDLQDAICLPSQNDLAEWYAAQSSRVQERFTWIVGSVLSPDSAKSVWLITSMAQAVEERAAAITYKATRERDDAVDSETHAIERYEEVLVERDELSDLVTHYRIKAERLEENYKSLEAAYLDMQAKYERMATVVNGLKAAQAALMAMPTM